MTKPTSYTTVAGYSEAELHIQKSRFIAYVHRVDTEVEAQSFVQKITKMHREATHNCYAYVVREHGNLQRSSDDGEPAGTAGRPILEVIRNRGLTDTVIVVTRYFGGIKLGAGGLIRAYSSSAAAGLDQTPTFLWVLHSYVTITVDYHAMGKVEHDLRLSSYEMEATQYTDTVTFPVWIPVGEERSLLDQIAEHTSGTAQVDFGKQSYRPRQQSSR
ncbi:uncharacterized protein, YigZ family [Marininema mesophilum]|uniref:Uncharacterized protein, YigZ family n=1 Tax=Marininema mesophilum TaxID=1048340 RepID=A0A1H2TGY6_9BACL|nr:YigZ family protein [Marininema mesophilum]SDW43108.1 uncharacterized protein, YigZ family [Marininema mesophilum]